MLYLMLIYQDEAKTKAATAEEQAAIGRGCGELNAFLAESGALRGTATWPAGITTVRSREGKMLTTDGPYAETREGLGWQRARATLPRGPVGCRDRRGSPHGQRVAHR
jgi:hypothetical protein